MLVIGVRGAGKSTLLAKAKAEANVHVVRVTTTRPRRLWEPIEYDHRSVWLQPDDLAWEFEVGGWKYGVRWSELAEVARRGIGVSLFHAGSLECLPTAKLAARGLSTVTVGLDTVHSLAEQWHRVGDDPSRRMTERDLQAELNVTRSSDYVLNGTPGELFERFVLLLRSLTPTRLES